MGILIRLAAYQQPKEAFGEGEAVYWGSFSS
jgi:hypothetical protein